MQRFEKHGFDFADAWEVFELPMLIVPDDRFDYSEERWSGLGILGNRIVKIIFTEIDDNTIRLISLRKALKYEREESEESFKNRLGPH
ncbi:MAG: BrnT family toxin [Pyrinomonadaceae bacterium]